MSTLRLQHTRTDGEVDTYHLKAVRRYHIGRGSDCEVRILDLKMSRKHCAIDRQGREWLLHDLGSTNGVRLDGTRVAAGSSVALGTGNALRIGNTELVVAGIDEGAAAEATPVRQEALPETAPEDEQPPAPAAADGPDPVPAPAEPAPGSSGALTIPAAENRAGDDAEDPASPGEAPPPADAADEPADGEQPQTIDAGPADPIAADDASLTPPARDANGQSPAADSDSDQEDFSPLPGTPPASAGPSAETDHTPVRVMPVGQPQHDPEPPAEEQPSLYINVLGRRIGPLSRGEARELKTRELKGTLTEADLDQYPGA